MNRHGLGRLAVTVLVLASCSKDSANKDKTSDNRGASRPAPSTPVARGDVVGYVHLPAGDSVGELGAAAELFEPGASAMLQAQMPGALRMATGMDLSAADLGAPLALVIVNPKKYPMPVGLLVKATDGKALRSAAKDAGREVVTRDGLSFVAAPDVLEAAQAFAFGQLSGPPDKVIVTVYPQPLLAAYRDEINAALQEIEREFAQAAGMVQAGFIVEFYRAMLSSIEGQVDRMELTVGTSKHGAELFWATYPVARSTFAGFVAAQTATRHSLLRKLPDDTDSAFVVSGTVRAGSARAALLALTDDWIVWIYGAEQAPALREPMLAWMALLDGEFAMVAGNPLQGMRMQYLTGITDAEATRQAWRSLWSEFAKMADSDGNVYMMGMKRVWLFCDDARTARNRPMRRDSETS